MNVVGLRNQHTRKRDVKIKAELVENWKLWLKFKILRPLNPQEKTGLDVRDVIFAACAVELDSKNLHEGIFVHNDCMDLLLVIACTDFESSVFR